MSIEIIKKEPRDFFPLSTELAIAIEIQLGVPLARGLGSSATAIVGGLVGANLLAGSPLENAEIRRVSLTHNPPHNADRFGFRLK